MSNQPYEGNGNGPYEGYDPYQQQQPPPGWPGRQQYEADAEPDQQQYTQQWEGQTWETQVQPSITPTAPTPAPAPSADTAYLPQQAPHGPGRSSTRLSTALRAPMAPTALKVVSTG